MQSRIRKAFHKVLLHQASGFSAEDQSITHGFVLQYSSNVGSILAGGTPWDIATPFPAAPSGGGEATI
jgi:hypothetical protein